MIPKSKSKLTVCLRFLLFSAAVVIICGCSDKLKIAWTQSPSAGAKAIPPPELQVYVENSGSMNGYMCAGSELKDALYGYVTELSAHAKTTQINYINSMVVPFGGSIKDFVNQLTPANFALVGGSHAHSDIADMLSAIVNRMNRNSVAVFLSDCILDVPQGDATNYFYNRRIQIESVIARKLRTDANFSVEVLRLESRFNGFYYDQSGKTQLNVKNRPYYIIILGNREALSMLNSEAPMARIPHGYTHYAAFTTPRSVDFSFTNMYGKEARSNSLELTPDGKGNYKLRLLANFSALLLDGTNATDPSMLKPVNQFTRIESIAPIKGDSQYSHVADIVLTQKVKTGGESLRLIMPEVPAWAERLNDETGRNIKSNLSKTSGIKYIIGGISDAYKERTLTSVKFTLKK